MIYKLKLTGEELTRVGYAGIESVVLERYVSEEDYYMLLGKFFGLQKGWTH